MEINTILSTSSQKDLDIEKSSNPGAQNTEGVTKAKIITPYVRKKKGVKSQPAHGEHTQHTLETSSLEKVLPSSTPFDASQTNSEMQPHSPSIQPSSPHSTSQISSEIFMIDNMEISNSPSLRLMGEPKIQLDTHHSERDDLLEYQSFISSMVVDTILQHQNISSQQPSTNVTHQSTANYPSMDIPSTANPSTDISHPLTVSSSMDIPSSSNPSLNDNVLSHLGTSYEEQIVISTLLGLSEGELKMSEGLSCSQEKGEDVCEKPLISSEMVSKDEGTSLVAEEKGEGVRESQVSQDEILMQKQRENERKAGTEDKLLKFAQEVTEELIKDIGGVEGPVLSTIAEEDEGDSDTKSVDSAQQDLDAISREPQEFTHPLPAYQVLASQSNQQAEQTLGLVHTEQSLRNAKASMASASTSAAPNSDSEERDNTEEESDEEAAEEAEWIDAPFFPVEHVLDEYKSQARKAMKEPMVDDPVHKNLSSSFMENLKLQKMQYISLHSDLKNVKDELESTKSKQKALFDERLPAYTMLTMDRKLKARIKDRVENGSMRRKSWKSGGEAATPGISSYSNK